MEEAFLGLSEDVGEDDGGGILRDVDPEVTTGDELLSDSTSFPPTDMSSGSSGSVLIRTVSIEFPESIPDGLANDSKRSSVVPSSQKLRPKSKLFCGFSDSDEAPVEALVDSTLNMFTLIFNCISCPKFNHRI